MWRYLVVELPRGDDKRREELLWEHGRAGWELVQVLAGSQADPADAARITLFFKRSATEEIGI